MTDEALKIKNLVEEMHLYNNPAEIEQTRKMLRKNVSFFMRGYLLSYLYIKLGLSKNISTEKKDKTSLYINLGSANKIDSKELTGFIIEKSNINSAQIFNITMKQGYSFITVQSNIAKTIINKINGQNFKGKKVKVNFSR